MINCRGVVCTLTFFVFAGLFARTPSQAAARQTAITAAYPNTPEGLQQQIADILASLKAKRSKEPSPPVEFLAVLANSPWFNDVFGAENGGKLNVSYKSSLQDAEHEWQKLFLTFLKDHGTEPQIRVWQTAADATNDRIKAVFIAMKNPATLYDVSMTERDGSTWAFPGPFVYINGAFRLVDWGTFSALPGVPPMRLRVGGNVMQRKLIHQVNPIPSPEAFKQRLAGAVTLRVIVGIDGKVKEVDVIRGDPRLTRAAEEAVHQWMYQPILLNGKAVEVETTVQINFNLSEF